MSPIAKKLLLNALEELRENHADQSCDDVYGDCALLRGFTPEEIGALVDEVNASSIPMVLECGPSKVYKGAKRDQRVMDHSGAMLVEFLVEAVR